MNPIPRVFHGRLNSAEETPLHAQGLEGDLPTLQEQDSRDERGKQRHRYLDWREKYFNLNILFLAYLFDFRVFAHLEKVLRNAGELVGLQVEEYLEVVSVVGPADDLRQHKEDPQHEQQLDLERKEPG